METSGSVYRIENKYAQYQHNTLDKTLKNAPEAYGIKEILFETRLGRYCEFLSSDYYKKDLSDEDVSNGTIYERINPSPILKSIQKDGPVLLLYLLSCMYSDGEDLIDEGKISTSKDIEKSFSYDPRGKLARITLTNNLIDSFFCQLKIEPEEIEDQIMLGYSEIETEDRIHHLLFSNLKGYLTIINKYSNYLTNEYKFNASQNLESSEISDKFIDFPYKPENFSKIQYQWTYINSMNLNEGIIESKINDNQLKYLIQSIYENAGIENFGEFKSFLVRCLYMDILKDFTQFDSSTEVSRTLQQHLDVDEKKTITVIGLISSGMRTGIEQYLNTMYLLPKLKGNEKNSDEWMNQLRQSKKFLKIIAAQNISINNILRMISNQGGYDEKFFRLDSKGMLHMNPDVKIVAEQDSKLRRELNKRPEAVVGCPIVHSRCSMDILYNILDTASQKYYLQLVELISLREQNKNFDSDYKE